MKVTVRDHRKLLMTNPNRFTDGIPRSYRTFVPHLKNCGYKKITLLRGKGLVEEIVDLLFAAQNSEPFYQFDLGGLPSAWNSPGQWELDNIHYEWGHLRSKNQNTDANNLENLSLQSSRCNQHIQASLNVDEVAGYGGQLADKINSNLAARADLFASEKWADIKLRLEVFK